MAISFHQSAFHHDPGDQVEPYLGPGRHNGVRRKIAVLEVSGIWITNKGASHVSV